MVSRGQPLIIYPAVVVPSTRRQAGWCFGKRLMATQLFFSAFRMSRPLPQVNMEIGVSRRTRSTQRREALRASDIRVNAVDRSGVAVGTPWRAFSTFKKISPIKARTTAMRCWNVLPPPQLALVKPSLFREHAYTWADGAEVSLRKGRKLK